MRGARHRHATVPTIPSVRAKLAAASCRDPAGGDRMRSGLRLWRTAPTTLPKRRQRDYLRGRRIPSRRLASESFP